jgi:chaperonin GroES
MSKAKLQPILDRVLVKPDEVIEKTDGGIIIPDTVKEKPLRGTVVEAGPGKPNEPMTVKRGDKVLYGKYSGTEIEIDKDMYLIMLEGEILAIL